MTIFTDNPFHPAPDTPLYQQLYNHLWAAILAGRLKCAETLKVCQTFRVYGKWRGVG